VGVDSTRATTPSGLVERKFAPQLLLPGATIERYVPQGSTAFARFQTLQPLCSHIAAWDFGHIPGGGAGRPSWDSRPTARNKPSGLQQQIDGPRWLIRLNSTGCQMKRGRFLGLLKRAGVQDCVAQDILTTRRTVPRPYLMSRAGSARTSKNASTVGPPQEAPFKSFSIGNDRLLQCDRGYVDEVHH